MNSNPSIPYGRQFIDEDDIKAVVDVLRSDWLTTGPKVEEFENAVADYTGSRYAVAVNSGTAALHCAMYAIGIRPGDEVIVPAMTFAATANCVVYQGGTPIVADVDPATLLIDPADVEKKITGRTKAIIAMDYAGQPCDYDRLNNIAVEHGLVVVDDGCHALGAEYRGRKIGSVADLTAFSFHPVKHITTGEGGMIVTNDAEQSDKMRLFRNHGINSDFHQRNAKSSWYYEMVDLGFNYRITDIQCALGDSQLKKLDRFVQRRLKIAACYDHAFSGLETLTPLKKQDDISHAYHLYVVQVELENVKANRTDIFQRLRAKGIGVNVHYIPVHLHPFYKSRFGTGPGICPVAEGCYDRILSLPIFPSMTDSEVSRVIHSVLDTVEETR